MNDTRAALHAILRHAADCYGGDLPVPVPVSSVRAPEPERDAVQPVQAVAPEPEPERDAASELAALGAEVAPCTKCKLHRGRSNLVFGEGSANARVMFIGEAPGQVEDETGRPFVGRSGQLLDKIIENAMGMTRQDVYIANINKCRPPGNRDPEPDEIATCLPWLRQQIAIIRPEVLVTLGRVACWNLLGITESMRRVRGRELAYEGIPVVPTWHPAYLLRNPAAKAETWEDIRRVNKMLGNPEIPNPKK